MVDIQIVFSFGLLWRLLLTLLVHAFWWTYGHFLLETYLIMKFLGHRLCVYSASVDSAKQLFKVIALIYTPISHVWFSEFQLLHILPTLAIVFFFLATLIDGCEVVMGLVCIVLMDVEVEYHFSCLLPICIFSLVIDLYHTWTRNSINIFSINCGCFSFLGE